MADQIHITPELRETHYVRATTPVAVTLHRAVAPGEVRAIPGRVLGEMRVNGYVHHYRVVDGNGVLMLVPPGWVQLMGGKAIGTSCPSSPVRAEVLA